MTRITQSKNVSLRRYTVTIRNHRFAIEFMLIHNGSRKKIRRKEYNDKVDVESSRIHLYITACFEGYTYIYQVFRKGTWKENGTVRHMSRVFHALGLFILHPLPPPRFPFHWHLLSLFFRLSSFCIGGSSWCDNWRSRRICLSSEDIYLVASCIHRTRR